MAKKLPKTLPTAVKRMSAGPIEDLPLQNKIRATRPSSKKLKDQTPPHTPPQPFPPKAGARVPV